MDNTFWQDLKMEYLICGIIHLQLNIQQNNMNAHLLDVLQTWIGINAII